MKTIKEAIEALPKNADEIAEYFQKSGIRGVRKSSSCCPLANYVRKQTSCDVGVGSSHVRYGTAIYYTSEALADFVFLFDMGWYSFLRDV